MVMSPCLPWQSLDPRTRFSLRLANAYAAFLASSILRTLFAISQENAHSVRTYLWRKIDVLDLQVCSRVARLFTTFLLFSENMTNVTLGILVARDI